MVFSKLHNNKFDIKSKMNILHTSLKEIIFCASKVEDGGHSTNEAQLVRIFQPLWQTNTSFYSPKKLLTNFRISATLVFIWRKTTRRVKPFTGIQCLINLKVRKTMIKELITLIRFQKYLLLRELKCRFLCTLQMWSLH